jgi:hypothetical protein
VRCELPAPLIRLNSEYLKQLMVAYGGKLYEQKTPNYFNKVATVDMRCQYREKPTSFELPQLEGILNSEWTTAPNWHYQMKRTKGRYIEFPIWRFCGPEEVLNNFPPDRVEALAKAIQDDAAYITAAYGKAPIEWLEALRQKQQNIVSPSALVGEELPF